MVGCPLDGESAIPPTVAVVRICDSEVLERLWLSRHEEVRSDDIASVVGHSVDLGIDEMERLGLQCDAGVRMMVRVLESSSTTSWSGEVEPEGVSGRTGQVLDEAVPFKASYRISMLSWISVGTWSFGACSMASHSTPKSCFNSGRVFRTSKLASDGNMDDNDAAISRLSFKE
jgi:hypothetical protein